MKSDKKEYASYKEYTAVKYGESSLIVKKNDRTVFHTGARNEKACKDLSAWLIDYVDHFLPELEAHFNEMINEPDDSEDI